MYASAVGLTDALWLCPEHALRLFLASVSFVDPVRTVAPLAPCLCWRCLSFASGSSCRGASSHTLGSVGAHGVSGGSTYPPDLVGLHIWPYTHWSSGRYFILFLCDIPQVFMAIIFVSFTDLCVSRPEHSHRVVFVGHLQRRVTGLT